MADLPAVQRVSVIPGAVTLTVYEAPADRFGPDASFLLYVTHGLERSGQREMIVGVLRRPRSQPAPGFPVVLARLLHQQAMAGTPAGNGATFIFAEPGFDADARITGVTCATAPAALPLSLPFPRPPLMAVPLIAGEATVARRYGPARVLAVLARRLRQYPFPWWFEPGREAVLDAERYGTTAAALMPACPMPFIRVVHDGPRLRIEVDADGREAFHRALTQAPLTCAFQADLGGSEASYVWEPGQRVPVVMAPESVGSGARIGCNYLIVGHTDEEPWARLVEDGFMVFLTDALRARLIAAAHAGGSTSIELAPDGGGSRSDVRGIDVVTVPPPRSWRPGDGPAPRHHIAGVDVVADATDLAPAGSADAVADLVKSALDVVDDVLADAPLMSGVLTVILELAPDLPIRAEIRSAAAQHLAGLADRLAALPPPSVSAPGVRFELRITVRP